MSYVPNCPGFAYLGCFVLLGGCTNDLVNLGGDRLTQELQSASRCSASPVVAESVRVRRQSELEALAGCEEIHGDLHIEIFADADLSPLASLRVVGGLLQIGSPFETPEEGLDSAVWDSIRRQLDQIVADGYLPSLHGLEGLERVGGLQIYEIAAENLEPLLGLREFSGRTDDFSLAGLLDVQSTANLRDLHGLSNAKGITHLIANDNLALSSLGGIQLGTRVMNINLINSPLLDDIDELAPVEAAYTLYLSNLGITDLDGLASQGIVESGISLTGNRNLVNIDRLAGYTTATLLVNENAVLQSIPALPDMTFLDSFTAFGNPELQSIALDLPARGQGPDSVQGILLTDPIKVFDIGHNAQLARVSLTAGLAEGRFLALYENPSLVSVELGTLTRLEQLSISGNPSLTSLDLGALRSVESLSVIDNPTLGTAPLAALRTFDAIVSGNADAPTPAP